MPNHVISEQLKILDSLEVSAFRTRSDEVQLNDVFVCRQGLSLDGHDFAQHAVERGASAVVCNQPLNLTVPTIVTESYYQSLALIKAYYRHPHQSIRHIGITGTNGKTTVSYCLNQILNQNHRSAYIGTLGAKLNEDMLPLNNTTPDGVALLNMFKTMQSDQTEFNVMELSSHALNQDRAGFVSLEVGVITNIGADHLDFHRTKDNYVQSKLQIVDRIQPNGTLVVNLSDPHATSALDRASKRVKVITFSMSDPAADITATNLKPSLSGMRFLLTIGKDSHEVSSPMPFEYNVENALAIASILASMGWNIKSISEAIENISMPPGRAQFIELSNGALGLVDYAHNSDGLNALLKAVREKAQQRLIVVAGVTGDRIQQAGNIGEVCAQYADLVIFTSDNPMGALQSELFRVLSSRVGDTPIFEVNDRTEAIALAKQLSNRGDLVVVCGKGNEKFQYVSDGKSCKSQYIGDLDALQQEETI